MAHRGAEVGADQLEVRGHLRADLPVIQAGLVVVVEGLLARAAAGGAAGRRRPQGRLGRSGTLEAVALAKRPADKQLSVLSGPSVVRSCKKGLLSQVMTQAALQAALLASTGRKERPDKGSGQAGQAAKRFAAKHIKHTQ